jgi:uncharacterized protein YjiK
MKYALSLLFLGWVICAMQAPQTRMTAKASHRLKVHEPSDLCLTPDGKGFYMVGDEGALHRTDLQGNIVQTADRKGLDFEGVYAQGENLWVLEEMTRRIIQYDPDSLRPIRSLTVPYFGGRNKGFECLTYNPVRKVYVMVTERDPVRIYELDEQFRAVAEYPFPNVADISGATFANGELWLLSDEEAMVYAVNPATYVAHHQWPIKVLNPEGIALTEDQLYIVSDDMATLYEFTLPKP